MIEDVNKAVAGMEHAFLSGQRSPSNKDLKKLIKHDHDVIEMVTRYTSSRSEANIKSRMIEKKFNLEMVEL